MATSHARSGKGCLISVSDALLSRSEPTRWLREGRSACGPSRKWCHRRAMSEMHRLADVRLPHCRDKVEPPNTSARPNARPFASGGENKVKRFCSSEAANTRVSADVFDARQTSQRPADSPRSIWAQVISQPTPCRVPRSTSAGSRNVPLPFGAGADQLELFRPLQGDILRHQHLRGVGGEIASP